MKSKKFKKWLLLSSAIFTLGTGGYLLQQTTDFISPVVQALELPSGVVQVGTIDNIPVVKSTTNDMSSPQFQSIVDSLVSGSSARYVVTNAGWQGNTSVTNAQSLGNFGSAAKYWLGQDGYATTDSAIRVARNQPVQIKNVGVAKDLQTGENIPLDMFVRLNDYQLSQAVDSGSLIMALRNENSVITIGFVAPAGGGANGGGGGQSEGGGGNAGDDGDGSVISYINAVGYSVTLVNQNTGQVLPDNETFMAIKASDIDGSQKAQVGRSGAKGYIVSPDTILTVNGSYFNSPNDGTAVNTDSEYLTGRSFVALKNYNTTRVNYEYTDNSMDHMDIVTGIFGNTGFEINLTGKIKVDKSLVDYGKTMPNELYSFTDIKYEILDKDGKVVDTLAVKADGTTAESIELPSAVEYGIRETTVNKITGQVLNTKVYKIDKLEGGVTTTVKTENKPVLGKITVKKTGVESETAMWNSNYTLAGNEFKLTSLTDGKTYTITTNDKGIAESTDKLPLGKYTVEEVKASDGFANTFESKEVELTWKDNQTELVFAGTSGTNQEVKGENKLEKEDAETGKDAQGAAEMATAEYTLYYNDDSTGSSPHKKGDIVKWSDIPKAKLLSGEKIATSYLNGQKVDNGDNIVISVDDQKLDVAVGNLALGQYYWQETNAPVGYVADKNKIEFEIKKQDDVTQNVITADTNSKENNIDIALTIQKLLEAQSESAESGFNDIEFTITPLEGTKGDVQTVTTGIDEATNEDGYAKINMPYGDYVIQEVNPPAGYDKIKDIYIHCTTDIEKDLITITASNNKDGSKPFSSRTYKQTDNLESTDKKTDDGKTIAGNLSADKFVISLSKMTYTDKTTPDEPTEPEKPVQPQPHKFDVTAEKVDLTGDKLLDDDSELSDRYADTAKDPYSDKTDNNEAENLNTKEVKAGQLINYQLWLDSTPYTNETNLQTLQMVDDYDETKLDTDVSKVKVYNAKGEDVTKNFKIEIKDGKLTVSANVFKDFKNAKGETVKVIDTAVIPLAQYYKIDFPTTVKSDIEAGVDIINSAAQIVIDSEGEQISMPTETRVNKTPESEVPTKETPKTIGNLPVTGEQLLLILQVIGGILIVIATAIYFYFKKIRKNEA